MWVFDLKKWIFEMVLMDENACLWFLQHRNDINKQFKEPKMEKNEKLLTLEARGIVFYT